MSQCRFRFDVGRPADTLIDEIASHVRRAGGGFGNGAFHLPTPVGEFKGDYIVDGSAIIIEVVEKPFFVPCSAIEAKLAQVVKEAR